MKISAFIFARSGSKGVPGKNIRSFAGKPLIAWSIEQALAVKSIDEVIVSTDSEEIASIALEYGAKIPFIRPKDLATDDSPEWLSWRHALGSIQDIRGALPELMVSIPTTSPLRLPDDIQGSIDEFLAHDCDAVITTTEAHNSPYFNMIKLKENNEAELVISPNLLLAGRQKAPKVYNMTTVAYVIRPEFVLNHNSIFEGRVRAVNIPVERSIDIDTVLDFNIAEYLFILRKKINA